MLRFVTWTDVQQFCWKRLFRQCDSERVIVLAVKNPLLPDKHWGVKQYGAFDDLPVQFCFTSCLNIRYENQSSLHK